MKKFTLPSISLKSISRDSLKSISLSSLKSLSLQSGINLQPRDRMALSAAAVAIIVFLVIKLMIIPFFGGRGDLESEIETRRSELRKMVKMKAEYLALSQNSESVTARLEKRRPKPFKLFNLVSDLGTKMGINVDSVNETKSTKEGVTGVVVKINGLTMAQLTTFLHGLEDPENVVWIKSINITKTSKGQRLLNINLKAETFQ